MGALYHNGHWYGGGQDINIQSDPQATSLNAGEVPTGDTIESVLNTNFKKMHVADFTTLNQTGAISLDKTNYCVLAAFCDNYLLIPYTRQDTSYCCIRDMGAIPTAGFQGTCTVVYIER